MTGAVGIPYSNNPFGGLSKNTSKSPPDVSRRQAHFSVSVIFVPLMNKIRSPSLNISAEIEFVRVPLTIITVLSFGVALILYNANVGLNQNEYLKIKFNLTYSRPRSCLDFEPFIR